MRLLGFSVRDWFRTGFAAVTFILVFKYAAKKANIPALNSAAGAV